MGNVIPQKENKAETARANINANPNAAARLSDLANTNDALIEALARLAYLERLAGVDSAGD